MGTFIQNGESFGFSTNSASNVYFVNEDESKTTVQSEISGIKQNIADLQTNKIIIEKKEKDNISIPANGTAYYGSSTSPTELTITKNGYNATVVSLSITNASSSGTGSTRCFASELGNDNITVWSTIYNSASTAAKVKLTYTIMYVKQ